MTTDAPMVATPAPPPVAARAGTSNDRLTVFCAAWSAYLLLHQCMIYYQWFRFQPQSFVIGASITALAAAAMLRPSKLWLMALLLAVHLAHDWRGMPRHANHTFLTICINLTILLALAWHAIAAAPGLPGRNRLYRQIAALVGLELIVLYFFVVLHKLNWDYMNPAVSCGVKLWTDIAANLAFLPTGQWTRWPCLVGALAAEAAIPLLLCFRRTRTAGIGLGLVFHMLLSLHPNPFVYSFSAMLFALYALFVPDGLMQVMFDRWQRSTARRIVVAATARWRELAAAALLVAAAAAGLMWAELVGREQLIDHLHAWAPILVRGLWYVAGLWAMCFYFTSLRAWRRGEDEPPALGPSRSLFFPALRTPLLLLPLLVLANGFSPYLGLKTESSFAMFANIRTEAGYTNHLFMPLVRVAEYQDDIVQISSTNDPVLKALAGRPRGIVYLEFRRRVSRIRDPQFEVSFTRNGVPQTLRKDRDAANEAFQPLPLLERKFLHFRTVQMDGQPQRCGH